MVLWIMASSSSGKEFAQRKFPNRCLPCVNERPALAGAEANLVCIPLISSTTGCEGADMAGEIILVVDDEPDVLEIIVRTLETDGFRTLSAFDGLNAIDLAESEQPDLVLLDIMMPMMSGYEVIDQLKANPHTQHIPIICLTSAESITARARSRKAGAAKTIIKPFSPAELVHEIRVVLDQKD